MPRIDHFEELHCWQESRVLARKIFLYSHEGKLGKDWDTKSQFRRAALSIMNNIAEGFERFSNKEKIRFMEIAFTSGNEVKSMLYLFEDIGYLPAAQIAELKAHTEKTKAMILGLIKYLKG